MGAGGIAAAIRFRAASPVPPDGFAFRPAALPGSLSALPSDVAWHDVPAEAVGTPVTAWRRLRSWTEAGARPRQHAAPAARTCWTWTAALWTAPTPMPLSQVLATVEPPSVPPPTPQLRTQGRSLRAFTSVACNLNRCSSLSASKDQGLELPNALVEDFTPGDAFSARGNRRYSGRERLLRCALTAQPRRAITGAHESFESEDDRRLLITCLLHQLRLPEWVYILRMHCPGTSIGP